MDADRSPRGRHARLSSAALDLLYQAGTFDSIKATATTSDDTALLSPTLAEGFSLELEGPWQRR